MNTLKFVEDLARAAGDLTLRYFRGPLNTREKGGNMGIVSEADIETEKLIVQKIKEQFPNHQILAEESSPEFVKKLEDTEIWMIDPIDGTTNFVQGNVYYNVSIALYKIREGKAHPVVGCVHQPYSKDLYLAEAGKGAFLNGKKIQVSQISDAKKGCYGTGFSYNNPEILSKIMESIFKVRSVDPNATVRVNGAAALDIARTAEGILDGFWEYNLSPWDMAAGNIIMREAGGVVTNFQGADFDPLRDRNIVCGSPTTHRLLAEILRPIFT